MHHRIAQRTDELKQCVRLPINQAHQLVGFLYADRDTDTVLNLPFVITMDCPNGEWKVWMNDDGRERYAAVRHLLAPPMTLAQAMA